MSGADPATAPRSCVCIVRADGPEHDPVVRDLLGDYLRQGEASLRREWGIRSDAVAALDRDMDDLGRFRPPSGRLLLAMGGGLSLGCAGLRTIAPGIGEVKRTYVRPAQRRSGIGRASLDALIDEARWMGQVGLRLDGAPYQPEAQALYCTLGFRAIAPYPESGIPKGYRGRRRFMGLPLHNDSA